MTGPDDALAADLLDLAEHLDVADTGSLADAVWRRIDEEGLAATATSASTSTSSSPPPSSPPSSPSSPPSPAPGPGRDDDAARRRPGRSSIWLRVAAAACVVVVGVGAFEPSRSAIASWLGIGAVRIELVERADPPTTTTTAAHGHSSASAPVPTSSAPEPPTSTPVTLDATEIAAVADRLSFPLHLADPAVAGGPVAIALDPASGTTPTSDVVTVTYPEFTLVELATLPNGQPSMAKLLPPGTTVTPVTVAGRPGMWIAGDPHELMYLDREGRAQTDTVRQAGNVLLWEDGGITHRIEGLGSLDRAQAIAASLP